RIDDKRLRLALLERRAGKAERILDRQADGLERIAAARDSTQLVAACKAAAAYALQVDAALSETAGALVRDERRRRHASPRHELEIDPDVVPLDDVSCRAVPADVRRTVRGADPHDRDGDREQEPRGDRIERARAEDPRREIDEEAEGQDRAPAPGHAASTTRGLGS